MRQPAPGFFPGTQCALIRGLIALLLVVALLLSSACTHLIFGPLKPHWYTPEIVDLEYENIYALTDDGLRLHGWKLHATTDHVGNLVFFHGNGENISTHFANVFWLADYGYDIYLFDYRGYGKSEGSPQLDDIVADVDVMLNAVLQQLPANEKLAVMGHSFGASLSIYAVAHSRYRDRISALISVAAFADYREVTQEILSRSWLTWALQWPLSYTIDNSYRPLDSIALVAPIPLFMMHASQDEIIALHHAHDLIARAHSPSQLVEIEGDHNYALNLDINRALIVQFLRGITEIETRR